MPAINWVQISASADTLVSVHVTDISICDEYQFKKVGATVTAASNNYFTLIPSVACGVACKSASGNYEIDVVDPVTGETIVATITTTYPDLNTLVALTPNKPYLINVIPSVDVTAPSATLAYIKFVQYTDQSLATLLPGGLTSLITDSAVEVTSDPVTKFMSFQFTNFPVIIDENIPLCYSKGEATNTFNQWISASGDGSLIPKDTVITATQNQPVAYFVTPNSTGNFTGTIVCKAKGNPTVLTTTVMNSRMNFV